MEHLYYVRRAKAKAGIERHDTLHAADNDRTFCEKELNEMWFIEPAHNLKPGDVNCISCRRALRPNAEVRGDRPLYGRASLSTDGLCSTVEAEK